MNRETPHQQINKWRLHKHLRQVCFWFCLSRNNSFTQRSKTSRGIIFWQLQPQIAKLAVSSRENLLLSLWIKLMVDFYRLRSGHRSIVGKTKLPHHWNFNRLFGIWHWQHATSKQSPYISVLSSSVSTDAMMIRNFCVVSEISFGHSLYSSLYNKHYVGNSGWVNNFGHSCWLWRVTVMSSAATVGSQHAWKRRVKRQGFIVLQFATLPLDVTKSNTLNL